MKNSVSLVAAALCGQVEPETDWWALLATGNKGWLGPDLFVSLREAGRLDSIPDAVREYLDFIHGKNLERNVQLRAQLGEALGTLNKAGIEPILLKGAIHLFTASEAELGRRMISDLDLSLAPHETAAARRALAGIGYAATPRSNEMGRIQDPGTVELHDRPSKWSLPYLAGDLRSISGRKEQDGAVAFIPPPTARALHLIVHDMIKEGDYWHHSLDLRHLWDFARLVPQIDWDELGSVLSDPTARRCLEVQAVTVSRLFGFVVPPPLQTARAGRRYAVRLHVAESGTGASLIRFAGQASWGVHRLATRRKGPGSRSLPAAVWRMLSTRPKGSRL